MQAEANKSNDNASGKSEQTIAPTRILCFSDTHGTPPIMPKSSHDVVMHAGDFYDRCHRHRMTSISSELRHWIQERQKPIFAVRGNHDCRDDDGLWNVAKDPNGNCMQVAPGLWVVGVGWSGRVYYELPGEEEIRRSCVENVESAIRTVKKGDKMIVLSHYPPSVFEVEGETRGWFFQNVRLLIDAVMPVAVICGHVHDLHGIIKQYPLPEDGPIIPIVFPGPNGMILEVGPDGKVGIERLSPVQASRQGDDVK